MSEDQPEEENVQMEDEPEVEAEVDREPSAVVERKQQDPDSQLSTVEIDGVEEMTEEDADEFDEDAALGASSAGTITGGIFSGWFSGSGRKGKEKQIAMKTRESETGLDQAEIGRIRREAAEASDRLDTVEELLDGIEASARQKVLAATKRFEVERTESAVSG
jgi:hypothetical protein